MTYYLSKIYMETGFKLQYFAPMEETERYDGFSE